MIAAPSSGAGKTSVTLGLLRALRRSGRSIAPFKSGPDYIDTGYHAHAAGHPSRNLDAWAMTPERLAFLLANSNGGVETTPIVEGAMGLFDGAADGRGSAADLAKLLGLRVALVVDCAKQSQSVAALVHGFTSFDRGVEVAGVILNKVGSERHEAMLRAALPATNILGVVRRDARLSLPGRHLGLMQAGELDDLEETLDALADAIEAGTDLDAFEGHAPPGTPGPRRIAPPGQRVAVASDAAFSFCYEHMLADWRAAGAEVWTFSPLANEGPPKDVDAIFLPGGYPELHAGRLAVAGRFREGVGEAAKRGASIYGECGGYMVLGDGLETEDGTRHPMLGLLRLETTFRRRRMQLGYRRVRALGGPIMGAARWNAHEFHYCTASREDGDPLFDARDALDEPLGPQGLRFERVHGSWMHLIDVSAP